MRQTTPHTPDSGSTVGVENGGFSQSFGNERWRLIAGDAIEVLSQLAPQSVDLIFADPPYNLSNDGFTCHAGRAVSVNKGEWDRSRGIEEDLAFHMRWIAACKRVLKQDGSIWVTGTYHSIYLCGYALQANHWHIVNDICWFKSNAAPNLSRRMFTASHETLIWARPSRQSRHYFDYVQSRIGDWPKDQLKQPGKQMRSVWQISTPKASEKRFGKHPTQKPLALLDRIIRLTSRPGHLVLDPFCGSGTTGVASIRNGRRFIGIDQEPRYLSEIALKRLAEEERQLSLPIREEMRPADILD